jgi:methionyl-tRNA formyltransferase
MHKKLVFLGSKPIGYNCLAHLISKREKLNVEIAGILTRQRIEFGEGNDLKRLANEHDIPVLNTLSEIPECDIIYSVQYHELLKQQHIEKAKQIAINLHMASLPEYRGANQFSFAIIDKKTEFGTTIHKIDSRIDHGDILFQERFPIPPECWVTDLYELTYNASLQLFRETLPTIIDGSYTLTPQKDLLEKYGCSLHYKDEIADLKKIDLDWDKEKIERYIRATLMPGFEPPYTTIEGKKVYLTQKPA